LIILEHLGEGGGHQRFTKADDITDEHSAAFVQVMCGDLHSGYLIVEQAIAEFRGDAKLRQAGASLLRKIIGDLDVNMVGRDDILTRQLSSMTWMSSLVMSTHLRSFQRSSNHLASS